MSRETTAKSGDSIEFFRRMFEYDLWANRQAAAALEKGGASSEKARKVMSHVVGAQRLWLDRFSTPIPANPQPFPDLPVEECRKAIEDLRLRWIRLLDGIGAGKLDDRLHYRNTKGVEFSTAIRDVLTHLLLHGAYHRGQVALLLRQADGIPSPTDFIVYVRETEEE